MEDKVVELRGVTKVRYMVLRYMVRAEHVSQPLTT